MCRKFFLRIKNINLLFQRVNLIAYKARWRNKTQIKPFNTYNRANNRNPKAQDVLIADLERKVNLILISLLRIIRQLETSRSQTNANSRLHTVVENELKILNDIISCD